MSGLLSEATTLLVTPPSSAVAADQQRDESPSVLSHSALSQAGRPPRGEPFLSWRIKCVLLGFAVSQYLGSSSISLFVMLDLNFEPVQLTHYWMYMSWVYWFNPVVGWLCDEMIIHGERRRPFALIGLLGNVACFLAVGFLNDVSQNYAVFVAVSAAQTLAQQMLSVPLNALIVEQGQSEDEGRAAGTARVSGLQSEAMLWRSIGSLIGAVLQTVLLLFVSTRWMLVVTAVAYAVTLPTLFLLPSELFTRWALRLQRTNEGRESFCEKWVRTCGALQQQCKSGGDAQSGVVGLVLVLAFVFVYSSMPDASIIYLSFLAYRFNFSAAFLSLNLCIGLVGSIIASWGYARYMRKRHRKEQQQQPSDQQRSGTTAFWLFSVGSFAWSVGYATNIMLATGFSLNTLSVPNMVFVPIDNIFTSIMSRVAYMPVISVGAERCPPGYEAVIFELFTAASIGGSSVSALVTATIATLLHISRHDFSNLWALLVVSAAAKLIPVVFAAFLPTRRAAKEPRPSAAADED